MDAPYRPRDTHFRLFQGPSGRKKEERQEESGRLKGVRQRAPLVNMATRLNPENAKPTTIEGCARAVLGQRQEAVEEA